MLVDSSVILHLTHWSRASPLNPEFLNTASIPRQLIPVSYLCLLSLWCTGGLPCPYRVYFILDIWALVIILVSLLPAGPPSSPHSHYIFRQDLSMKLEFTILVVRLASKTPNLHLSLPPSTRIIGMHITSRFSHGLGIKLRASCLYGNYFICSSMSTVPELLNL